MSQTKLVSHLPSYFRFLLLLASHLSLGLPTGVLLSGFPTKILYTVLLKAQKYKKKTQERMVKPVLDFVTGTGGLILM